MIPYLTISGLLSLSLWVLLLVPAYLTDRGWSSQKLGWAVGLYFLVNLVFQIVAGRLVDRFGYLRVALAGAGIGILGGLFYVAMLWLPALVFPARFLHAAGAAMIFVGALLQLVESVPQHLRGRVIGYYGLPGFVMMGIGPVLGEWFSYHWSFAGILGTEPILFMAVAGALWWLPRSAPRRAVTPRPISEAFRESFKPLRSVVALSAVFGFCFSSWNSFLALAVRSLGHGGVSAFGLGYGFGAVATRLGLSHYLDRGAARYVGIGTLVLYGSCLAWIPHAANVTHLLIVGGLSGMVHGTFYPSLSSIAADRFHPIHTGQAMSLYLSASALGMFAGPPLWGAMSDQTGFPPMFWSAGIVMAAGTVWFLYRQRHDYRMAAKRGLTEVGRG